MKRLTLLYILVPCLLVLGLCGGCQDKGDENTDSFALNQTRERGPLIVHLRVDPNQLSIADLLTVQLEAGVKSGYAVRMPAVDPLLKDFGIVDWDDLGERLGEDSRVFQTLRYRLEPFLSGDYELPAFTFEFFDVNEPNTVHTLSTEPIAITVTSLLGEDRANLTIAEIETVVDVPRPPLPVWVWIMVATVAVALVGLIIYLARRQTRVIQVRIMKPAHEIAYARLQALVDQDLIEKGEIKLFYETINHILRHYIEDRFQLHAPERTTEEFLQELYHDTSWSGPEKDTLGAFLAHCDLVKFAKHQATTEEIQLTFDQVKSLIETTRSDQHQVDVTDWVADYQEVEA